MKKLKLVLVLAFVIMLGACQSETKKTGNEDQAAVDSSVKDTFNYFAEQFADLRVLRYKVPGFDDLSLKQKKLLYYLHEAALSGRDIAWDQKYKNNLLVRHTLEGIVKDYKGPRESADWDKFMVYTKRVWFSNGIHHHYSTMKIKPEFPREYFKQLMDNTPDESLPLSEGVTKDDLTSFLTPVLFDPNVAPKDVNLDPNIDMVKGSATNFYDGVTQKEVEDYYKGIIDTTNPTPISYGLNSQVAKENGKVVEHVWKVGGMYSPAIEKIVYWLEKAKDVAEDEQQAKTLGLLIDYYKTGNLKKFDEYNIAWVNDTASRVDVVNGFIEVYGDPLGYKGAFESVVSIKDLEATKRIKTISSQAQWFEDNSPLMEKHKKKNVTGITAKVITVITESGDASPSTPIGINLPNSNWIRTEHGSKSVNLGNIVHSYNKASEGNGMLEEFAYSDEQVQRARKYGALASDLLTDMHEVIGHASGQLEPGVGTPKETLKNYSSTLEEARADLVALYYIMDPKLVELGLMPSLDVGKTEYDSYILNGLMLQLRRLEPGDNLEEAHMRNRQTVAKWVLEKGKKDNVIERKEKDGKTYYVINDYEKLRTLFGDLLREIQRIKSQGDYEAGKALVENYGVKVDEDLHKEVLERAKKLNIAPYSGFINPILEPVKENGEIVDVKIRYPEDFKNEMLYYSDHYSFLKPNPIKTGTEKTASL